MPDDPILWSVALGIFNIIVYSGLAVRNGDKPTLDKSIMLLLGSAGIYGGVRLCWVIVNPNILPGLENERIHVFLGGFALLWVSALTVIQILVSTWLKGRRPSNNPGFKKKTDLKI